MSNVVGVILAGGRGARMGALGREYPKALLPLGGRPLITHHLELLEALGVHEVFILVGHRAGDLVAALGPGHGFDLAIRFVDQGEYLGSAHALSRFRGLIDDPLILLLGDYYCSLSEPRRLLARLAGGASAIAVKREPNEQLIREACEVRSAPDGRVVDIVEKPARPKSDLKGCGAYALQPEIFDAVARTPRTALRNEYELTHSLQLHVEHGGELYGEEIVSWDRNFTRPDDVLDANLDWLERVGEDSLTAEEVCIEDGATVERSVIGNRARVGAGSRLHEVVVFDGATVPEGMSLERALVTPDGVSHLEPAVAAGSSTK